MKKRALIFGSAVLAACLSMGATAFAANISDARAKEIALNHAGVNAADVTYSFAKLDFEHGVQIYEVEFMTKDFREYDYEISVADGSIISYDYDAEAQFYSYIPAGNRTVSVTVEQAKQVALNHAGKNAQNVMMLRSQMDYDDGLAVYEIEFIADGVEYDYDISAYTGEIVSFDHDAEYQYLANNQAKLNTDLGYGQQAAGRGYTGGYGGVQAGAQTGAQISAEEAKAIALRQAGLSASNVSYIYAHLDYDDGRLLYEGSFVSGMWEYDFEIDATTGAVWDFEIDHIYD